MVIGINNSTQRLGITRICKVDKASVRECPIVKAVTRANKLFQFLKEKGEARTMMKRI